MSNVKGEGLGGIFAPLDNKDGFWEQTLRLSEQRLTVLASNIANADTPHYKARDTDFQAALRQALDAGQRQEGTVAAGAAVPPEPALPAALPLLYRVPMQGAVDGNTVDMDAERAAFADQAIRHEFFLQKAIDQYKEISTLFRDLTE